MSDETPTKTAHLAEIYLRCEGKGCWKAAKVDVIDQYDGPQGRYCTLCADRVLKRLWKEEAAARPV